MTFVNRDNFTSYLPICRLFIYFSCLIALGRTSNTVLNSSGKSGHHIFVPDLRGKLLVFAGYYVSHRLFIYGFYYVEVSFLLFLVRQVFFIMKGFWICQMLCLHWWCGSCPAYLLVWYITLVDFYILNHSCIPDINPTWAWCIHLIFGLLMFCWEHLLQY